MSGHIGLREEKRAGRLLALQIARLFTPTSRWAESHATITANRLGQLDGSKPLRRLGSDRSF
jgi:hypothetical protein